MAGWWICLTDWATEGRFLLNVCPGHKTHHSSGPAGGSLGVRIRIIKKWFKVNYILGISCDCTWPKCKVRYGETQKYRTGFWLGTYCIALVTKISNIFLSFSLTQPLNLITFAPSHLLLAGTPVAAGYLTCFWRQYLMYVGKHSTTSLLSEAGRRTLTSRLSGSRQGVASAPQPPSTHQ